MMQYLALCRMYMGLCKLLKLSYSHHDAGILVPGQHRILAAAHLRIVDVSPPSEEVLVCHYTSQSSCQCTVDVFHDAKVGREQDVEIALIY